MKLKTKKTTGFKKPQVGDPLTRRQDAILSFIRGWMLEGVGPPTVREIGSAFGWSPNGVTYHLQSMEAKGVIWRVAGQSRNIRLVQLH